MALVGEQGSVVQGGSWNSNRRNVRCACRKLFAPNGPQHVGFTSRRIDPVRLLQRFH
jgi:hypothetical protein